MSVVQVAKDVTAADQFVGPIRLPNGHGTVYVYGTFVATFLLEYLLQGETTWHPAGESITSEQNLAFTDHCGTTQYRVRCSAFTSGTPSVVLVPGGA